MSQPNRGPEIMIRRKIEGYWKHVIHDDDGKILDPGKWSKNLIVDRGAELMAAFLLGDAATFPDANQTGPFGIQYYALGIGNASWDANPVQPTLVDTQLENEFDRRVPTITYLDASDVPTATPTTKLQLTTSYAKVEVPDINLAWREFGVFCGNATVSPNSGFMFNHVTHGVFNKSSSVAVTRLTRFVI